MLGVTEADTPVTDEFGGETICIVQNSFIVKRVESALDNKPKKALMSR